jgi:hypothetical protein
MDRAYHAMTDLSRHLSQPAAHQGDQLYELSEQLDRRFERERAMGSGNVFNGSTKLISWLLGINALLIVAAISGGISYAVNCSGRMASLEAKMEILMLRLK